MINSCSSSGVPRMIKIYAEARVEVNLCCESFPSATISPSTNPVKIPSVVICNVIRAASRKSKNFSGITLKSQGTISLKILLHGYILSVKPLFADTGKSTISTHYGQHCIYLLSQFIIIILEGDSHCLGSQCRTNQGQLVT